MENINTKALIRLVGINENTLRAWERRYNAVTPVRDSQGHRLYSAKDIERVKLLWALVKEGHTIGRIAGLPTSKLKKIISASISPELNELLPMPSKTEQHLKEMIYALDHFNLERLNLILQKVRFEISSKEIVINLIRPLMEEVGSLIESNKLSITQEHILSSLLRDYLGNLHQSLSPYDLASRGNAKRVLLTTREGDIHEFGILLSSILCNLYRYKTYYLGTNLPIEDLVEASLQFKVDYIILGLMALPKRLEVISAEDYIRSLDQRLPRKVTICLGGSQKVDVSKIKSERRFMILNNLGELDHFLADNARS